MLKTASPLEKSQLSSLLAGTSKIRPSGARYKRNMVASLMLTSLVDAFSILVIFLIMNHSANQDVVNIGEKIQLPHAQDTQIIQTGVVVRVEGGQFFVEDKLVAQSSLVSTLKSLNSGAEAAKKDGIIVVADRQMDYADLSPVILAGSTAGFTKFKFAVISKN
jgi:biopolymer transport protein ExbD